MLNGVKVVEYEEVWVAKQFALKNISLHYIVWLRRYEIITYGSFEYA